VAHVLLITGQRVASAGLSEPSPLVELMSSKDLSVEELISAHSRRQLNSDIELGVYREIMARASASDQRAVSGIREPPWSAVAEGRLDAVGRPRARSICL